MIIPIYYWNFLNIRYFFSKLRLLKFVVCYILMTKALHVYKVQRQYFIRAHTRKTLPSMLSSSLWSK